MSEELESWKHSYRLLEEERQRLAAENARLREALRSIACLDGKPMNKLKFWLSKTHEECAEVCANDTNIARAALEGKE